MPSNAVICRAFTGCGTLQCGSPGSSETRTTEERRMGEPSVGVRASEKPVDDRLDSWKEIAAYLNRDVTTVQRWEKREGMPVYRHLHDRMGSVYASRAELDDWTFSRNLGAAQGNPRDVASAAPLPDASTSATSTRAPSTYWGRWRFLLVVATVVAVAAIAAV